MLRLHLWAVPLRFLFGSPLCSLKNEGSRFKPCWSMLGDSNDIRGAYQVFEFGARASSQMA